MPDIDALFEQIDDGRNVDRLRLAIAEAIAQGLAELRETFGYWEKAHIAHAIAALARNVNAGKRDTTSWLRLSLVSLELAYTPIEKRSEDYTPRNKEIDALTYEELVAGIRSLGATR